MANPTKACLEALEQDRSGDWDGAHHIVQSIEHPNAYWVHAYLHRKEGDYSNAGYWYTRAGRSAPSVSLAEEWQEIYDVLGGE